MECTINVDDTVEFEKGDVNSKSSEEGNISDEHDYDYDSSLCSVSLGSENEDYNEDPILCSKLAATDIMVLELDESADTAWTNEKHSSYLDSMEATFVRKMYHKEYCSVDVCGYSSNSSVTGEQDCVESHPLYLNMRKPYKQAIEVLPARAFSGTWITTSSLLASPWIQHFKSKQVKLTKNDETHDDSNGMEHSGPYTSKKREALFEAAECNPSPRSSHGTIGGGFKKLKCEQDLSHMDMKMEEQYNAKQQIQDSHQQDEAQAGETQELIKLEAVFSEAGEAEKATKVKELPKEEQDTAVDVGIPASMMPKVAICARNCDQLHAL